MSQAQLDQMDKIGRQVREAIVAPYLSNDDDMDIIDYTCIMDSLGDMKYLSTQVLQDVVDEIVGEIESRP